VTGQRRAGVGGSQRRESQSARQTDVARESASVLLLGDDLTDFPLLKIARQCHRIIMTNFFGTLAVTGVGSRSAAMGMLNPSCGVLIHVTSE